MLKEKVVIKENYFIKYPGLNKLKKCKVHEFIDISNKFKVETEDGVFEYYNACWLSEIVD